MDFILNLFTKKELLIIGLVIGSLILVVLILTVWDIVSRKRKENKVIEKAFDNYFEEEKVTEKIVDNLIEEKKEVEQVLIEEDNKDIETLEVEEPLPIKKNEMVTKVEEIETNNIETNVVQDEIAIKVENVEPLIMDIEEEKVEDKREKAKLELLEIEEALKNPKSLEDTLYDLEAIEEENAIISYQELLENTREVNVVNTDSGDEPISIKEILNMYESTSVEEELDVSREMSKTSIDDAYKGDFTSTPYLSPIVGFENEVNQSVKDLAEIQLENTANLEKLDKEIRKTNEFLTILNDLKKNLD